MCAQSQHIFPYYGACPNVCVCVCVCVCGGGGGGGGRGGLDMYMSGCWCVVYFLILYMGTYVSLVS